MSTNDKRVVAYMNPLYKRIIQGLAFSTGITESRLAADIIKKEIDAIPDDEKKRLLQCQQLEKNQK